MDCILEVNKLNKSFDKFSLTEVSFKLKRGFIMGFIGPNGAGKSTTIKLILNLIKKDSGEIKLFGLDNIKYEKNVKDRIGVVLDESCFYEELTVNEMKHLISRAYSRWDETAFQKYMKEFSILLEKKIKELSRGMKMKFSLACALSHHAEFLIMDEPTSGLDPIVRSELLDILSYLIQDENKGIFFSTHITTDLDKIADYIILINEGKIVLSSEKDLIREKYALIKGGKELLDDEMKKLFIGIRENQFGFEGLVKDREQVRNYFKQGIFIEKPTLEDIMLHFTRRSQNV